MTEARQYSARRAGVEADLSLRLGPIELMPYEFDDLLEFCATVLPIRVSPRRTCAG